MVQDPPEDCRRVPFCSVNRFSVVSFFVPLANFFLKTARLPLCVPDPSVGDSLVYSLLIESRLWESLSRSLLNQPKRVRWPTRPIIPSTRISSYLRHVIGLTPIVIPT